MSKFKEGLVSGVKKKEEYRQHQNVLHKKHKIADSNVMIVEKNNLGKFTVRTIARMIQVAATIALCILATIGLIAMVYPNVRGELLITGKQMYEYLSVLLGV